MEFFDEEALFRVFRFDFQIREMHRERERITGAGWRSGRNCATGKVKKRRSGFVEITRILPIYSSRLNTFVHCANYRGILRNFPAFLNKGRVSATLCDLWEFVCHPGKRISSLDLRCKPCGRLASRRVRAPFENRFLSSEFDFSVESILKCLPLCMFVCVC